MSSFIPARFAPANSYTTPATAQFRIKKKKKNKRFSPAGRTTSTNADQLCSWVLRSDLQWTVLSLLLCCLCIVAVDANQKHYRFKAFFKTNPTSLQPLFFFFHFYLHKHHQLCTTPHAWFPPVTLIIVYETQNRLFSWLATNVNMNVPYQFDVRGSVHHSTIHKENPTRCNNVSNFIIPCLYETQRVSGDTPPIIRSLKLH